MRICIVSPVVDTTMGNSITAERWRVILQALGNEITPAVEWDGQDCDLLIALHALRSNPSIERFHKAQPQRPLIVALTGTDLYVHLEVDAAARRSIALATRIVVLQDRAADELNPELRERVRVIYQHAVPPRTRLNGPEDCVQVCVLSHLRSVKDPLRAAWAARILPPESLIRIVHAGRVLEPKWEQVAREESRSNPRYQWLGDTPHDAAMQLLAGSHLLVLSSEAEGGANAIAEAVACNVPILCSEIPGNIGMLGPDYPGYFRLRDTQHLAQLLNQAETDPIFIPSLKEHTERLEDRFSAEQETRCWRALLDELKTTEP